MIRIENLCRYYGKTKAIDDVSCEFLPGKLHAILGTNGAGKSTLMRVMCNMEHASAGSCKYSGHDISGDALDIKSQLAFISEDINFSYHGTIKEFLQEYKKFYQEWDDSHLNYIFKKGLVDPNVRFEDISRGQKMQIALAASMARKPNVIIIDEITAVMDIFARKYFTDALKDYCVKENAVVILATNILSEIDFITDNLLILKKGKIIVDGHYNTMANQFVKLRNFMHENDPIFQRDDVIWLHRNSDGSSSYLVPKENVDVEKIHPDIIDKRKVSIQDIFGYYSANLDELKPEEHDDQAA